MKKHLITILAVVLLFTLGTAGAAFAADDDQAGDKGYTYRVTIYSGNQGIFDSGKVWKKDYNAGDSLSISTEDLGFKLTDKKYYVRGFRVAGHDNDETTGIQRLQIDNIDTDVAYEVAYGIKGALVAYTVNYQDENGKALRKSDTYYGMPGDKPVVSYRYVDGYTPNAYTQGKELTSDEAKNVFTFIYTRGATPQNPTPQPDNGGNNQGANNAANAGNAAAAGAGALAPGTAGNPAGTGAPGQGANTANIGNNDTPLADGPQQYTDIDGNDTPLANGLFGQNGIPFMIGIAVLLLIIIALIAFLLRRRKAAQDEGPDIEE